MSIASNVTAVIVSSAVVAAVVGALSSFVTQRYLLVKKAQIDSDAMERKALLDYQSLARQHLMEAIGPLRMQLLFGAREALFTESTVTCGQASGGIWTLPRTMSAARYTASCARLL